MPCIVIRGVEISFPFDPYPAQVEYMQAVMDALDNAANALLESPTGTGKTLCLLCAVLAWLEKRQSISFSGGATGSPGVTRVVYCSRTHTQLSHVIRELKKTSYSSAFSMAIMGSREHMCVHSQVLRLQSVHAQQAICNSLREDKNCHFYRGFQSRLARNEMLSKESCVHDMEDLFAEGYKCGFCPYYWERELAKESSIIFLPYNYIFDSTLRRQLPFDLKDCVLIVDEAHNLPSVLGSSFCVNLQPLELANAIHDCSRAIAARRAMKDSGVGANDDTQGDMEEQELASLKIILCNLEKCIAEEPMELEKEEDSGNSCVEAMSAVRGAAVAAPSLLGGCEIVRKGSYIIPFLEKALITRDLYFGHGAREGGMSSVITKAITLLSQSEMAATGLTKVQQLLAFVFERCGEEFDEACRFVLASPQSSGAPKQRVLGYWCLDISPSLQTLVKSVHSLILTSGTLSPLDHFAAEIGIHFEVCLSGGHVIAPSQVAGCILCKGPSGERLNGSYAFRSSLDYRIGLGMALVNISRNTPGGVLVFFPSYVALNAAVDLWRAGSGRTNETETIWAMLEHVKPVFVEPTDVRDTSTIVTSFQREVDAAPSRGAILLAVCRGKVSEGINFADNHGRCVLVAGIPFANYTDLFVRLKREYVSSVAAQRPKVRGRTFTGDDWYINEAMRCVNQCVGRVIRHKDDYGVVVLADERFSDKIDALSGWLASRCTVHREFRGTYAAVAQFFATFKRRKSSSAVLSSTTETAFVTVPTNNRDSTTSCLSEVRQTNMEAVPDSADMARRFAQEQLQRAVAEREEQKRRHIEEISQLPVHPVKGKVGEVSESDGGSDITPSLVSAPPSPFKKQVLPALAAASSPTAPASLVGASSKEFCLYLKQRLQPLSYSAFRDVLKQIADIRASQSASSEEKKALLSSAVTNITVLFKEAAGDQYCDLLNAFGRHIPEEFQLYYSHLLRKRRRM
ncbi:putative helicase [Trypanosoma vivax]|nr:putative helicase [Trypanosoma vivax]